VRRFTQANRTGAYLRVIENGEIGAGDTVDAAVDTADDRGAVSNTIPFSLCPVPCQCRRA
jgi:MOSC domain-containing protein YiiM